MLWLAAGMLLTGCFKSSGNLLSPDAGTRAGGSNAGSSAAQGGGGTKTGGSGGSGSGGSGGVLVGTSTPDGVSGTTGAMPGCTLGGDCMQVATQTIDKDDLLFMIDNSSSMQDKQKNLRQHVPEMVKALVNGKRTDTDPHPFPPVTDLHIAVVDSDMGLVGVNGIPGCTGFGHDGNFQNTPHVMPPEIPTCDASYPPFLTYMASPVAQTADPALVAKLTADFGCIANVGAKGCGFEQQLESVLKALWPSKYIDPKTMQVAAKNPITFLTDSADPQEAFGHGDGSNTGFQRNNPATGLSLLAIVVLSDEDDGSAGDMGLYAPYQGVTTPPSWLDPQTVNMFNLRPLIGANRDHLYPVSRYINGFKALRPNNEQLVVFAAIAGLPLDLVNDGATTGIDFSNQTQRDAYYDMILADPRMQNVIDPTSDPNDLKVKYACDTPFGHGFPGQRYVQVAKGIGENATVYSICENDYTPALNNVVNIVAKQLSAVCLPNPLVRGSSGTVKCNVAWALPSPSTQHSANTPIACSERSFLSAPGAGLPTTNADGGQICVVKELPVVNQTVPSGDGWFYDDFSKAVQTSCDAATPQRVSFSGTAKPPTGVTVYLDCAP